MELKFGSLISPLGIARLFQILFSCTAFSLVAAHESYHNSYGAWSMFTWCLCFAVSIVVVVVELIGVAESLPLSWQDFTSAFSMLAALMIFTTSIVYPSVFIPGRCKSDGCSYEAAATAMSCFCFVAYAVEVGLTRAKEGEVSSFLASVPGLLKVFEAYVACLIFSLVDYTKSYTRHAGLQWCLAVYCICFIITLLIIILTVGRCLAALPIPLDKTLVGYNLLAVLMYVTAAIVWPIYSFRNFSRPSPCNANTCAEWNNRLGVTFLTFFNLIAYIVDLVYSSKMVFVTTPA
nr:myeloid-associated differentiation marker homolog [Pogona vitticeps]